MANLIQIKRSTTASTPGSLANGELAFTSNGDVLYIGSPNGSVVAIGGVRVPGFLTANQALVANIAVASISDVQLSQVPPANNSTLVFNTTNNKYVVRQMDLDGGNF